MKAEALELSFLLHTLLYAMRPRLENPMLTTPAM